MKIIVPNSFPEAVVEGLQALDLDLLLTSERDLAELFHLSAKERRVLLLQTESLPSASACHQTFGIVALDTTARTPQACKKHLFPYLKAASETQFEGNITFFDGKGGVEVTRIQPKDQRRENILIPRGTNEQFLHFAANGLRELRSTGVDLAGFTSTLDGYRVERYPIWFHFLAVVIKGHLDLSVDGSPFRPLHEKCTFIIPNGTHCTYRAKGPTAFLWMHIHSDTFGHGIGDEVKESRLLYPNDLIDYCKHFRSEARSPNADREVVLAHLANLIGIAIHRNIAALGMQVELDEIHERLKKALRTLEDNLASCFSVGDLAREAGISVSRLYRETQKYFDRSPGALIEELRARHARELLLHSEYKLEKVAEMTGYSDGFSFSRAFKRLTGMSPSSFRQKRRQAPP